jgi:hypothetical protein
MSVNHSININPKKTKHLGPIFHTIDYDFDSKEMTLGNRKFKLNQDDIQDLIYQCNERWLKGENFVVLNGFQVDVTLKELERINETCENIKRVNWQRYRFFGK